MRSFTLKAYLRDKLVDLVTIGAMLFVVLSFCGAFRLGLEVTTVIILTIVVGVVILYVRNYCRRRRFYATLQENLQKLDQAYLVTETITRPDFLEGEILHDVCYEIGKSMLENISKLAEASQNFREYIELWVHEVKSPLTVLNLLASKTKQPELEQELAKVDDLAEQVLYFMRAQSSEQDYLLGECNIGKVVKAVLQSCRTQIQLQNIEIVTEGLDQNVHSDAKWLQFMIGQILVNALKYGAKEISFRMPQDKKTKILKIRDNGVGIPAEDLPRVFDRTFTGRNGHSGKNLRSTGMGLYLVKTLTDKLGHRVQIHSKTGKDSYTEVEISFGEHDYYKNVR